MLEGLDRLLAEAQRGSGGKGSRFGVKGLRVLGFRVLEFWVLGCRVLGFRV